MLRVLFGNRASVAVAIVLVSIITIVLWIRMARVPTLPVMQEKLRISLLHVESEPEPTSTSTWPSI